MTENQTDIAEPTLSEAADAFVKDEKAVVLVRTGLEQIAKKKTSLADLFQSVVERPDTKVPDKSPPLPKKISPEQEAALKRLPEVYGKTVVHKDRKLTDAELVALVEERDTIDEILSLLKPRKEESIREVLANHFDNILTDEEKADARKDRNGHYAVKQSASAPGTGRKVNRSVSGGKPVLTMAHIESLHEQGLIDRKTYLAITKKPDLPRVLNEEGLHKAIQKDPRLFFLLGSVAEPTLPTTTIKVEKDS